MSGTQDTDPLALVLDALRHVLGGEPPLAQDTDLFALPGFDSLALEVLVAELEDRIGRPVDDDLVTPEVFATPGTIARGLVSVSLRGEGDEARTPSIDPEEQPMSQISDEFRAVLLRHLVSVEDPAEIPADVNLRSLGLNSMRAVELVIDLEDTLGVVFPDDAFNDEVFRTAATLWDAISHSPAGETR